MPKAFFYKGRYYILKVEKLAGETVIHRSYGTDIVRKIDNKYLEVDFPEKNKKSTFAYPLNCSINIKKLCGKSE